MSTIIDNHMRIGGTAILRNANLDPLDDGQLKKFAPTIFARRGIEGVSDSYGLVRSNEIVNSMRANGYECVEVRQSQRRDSDRMPFTKHMLKFRKAGNIKALMKKGDVIPQVIMLNSHDRSSGFHLYAGMFRLVCSNGLMVSESALVEPIKVRHSTHAVADIVDKAGVLVKGADGVYAIREEMLRTSLTERQAIAFANSALAFRPPRRSGILEPAMLLEARRTEDKPNDLWHVFNRVQENMLRGGNEAITADGRKATTKGIGRIERDVEVNSALWGLAVLTAEKLRTAPKRGGKVVEDLGI